MANVLMLAQELQIPHQERRIALAELYTAQEVFTTTTMDEITIVSTIDGRIIGSSGNQHPITARLLEAYQTLPERPGLATEIPDFE